MLRHGRLGQSSMISLALYSSIIVVGISTVVVVGTPILEDMRDSEAVTNAKDILSGMEDQVRAVAAGGKGSRTSVGLQFGRGEFVFDAAQDAIKYQIETNAPIIGKHASQQIGNLQLSSMADVSITNDTVNGVDCWRMENEHISTCIRQIPENTSEQIEQNTIGYWRFNENIGLTAKDSSQYGNDGYINGARWTDGVQDSGLSFDGESDFVNVTDLQNISATSSAYTVSFWARIKDDGEQGNAIDFRKVNGIYILEKGNGNMSMVHIHPNGWNQTFAPLTYNTWELWTQVWNGSNVFWYRNGNLIDTAQTDSMASAGHAPRAIGANPSQDKNYFNGALDDVRVWNRALSGEEIQWLYSQRGRLDYIGTGDLVLEYYNKDTEEYLDGNFSIRLNKGSNVRGTHNGTGYVEPHVTGTGLGRGRINAHVNSFFGVDYTVRFDLLSKSDFLSVEVND